MKLVQRGINSGDQEGSGDGTADSLVILTEGPIEKGSENRVLSEMRAFPDDELNPGNRRSGDIGHKPAQEWSDEPGRMLGRHQIGGADENKNHPEQNRQPILQK